MEMPRIQALIRLYSMWSDTPSPEVQEMVEAGNPPDSIWDMVEIFKTHRVVDHTAINVDEMSQELELTDPRPEFVVVDYLELMGGAKISNEGGGAVDAQATMLKDWAKREEMRVFVLHQTNRANEEWKPVQKDDARYGGFTEADFVVGIWRPHRDPKLDLWEKIQKKSIIAANVLKNRAFFEEKEYMELSIKPSLRIRRENERNTTTTEKRTEQPREDVHPSTGEANLPDPY